MALEQWPELPICVALGQSNELPACPDIDVISVELTDGSYKTPDGPEGIYGRTVSNDPKAGKLVELYVKGSSSQGGTLPPIYMAQYVTCNGDHIDVHPITISIERGPGAAFDFNAKIFKIVLRTHLERLFVTESWTYIMRDGYPFMEGNLHPATIERALTYQP